MARACTTNDPHLVNKGFVTEANSLCFQVCDFVKNLSGCSDYVEDFQLQEIDGQALMLLKADHLMSAMQIKLGPALKICSAIDEMREALKQN